MSWFARAFFLVVAAFAVAGVVGGTACTRRGGSGGTVPPTSAPQSTFYVDPKHGSDTTGNGTSASPYKTLTKALAVVAKSTVQGPTIQLNPGVYSVKTGETFPIVVSTAVTINGSNYGGNPAKGSFVSGAGEDTAYEKATNGMPRTAFATIVIASGTSATINNIYAGAPHLPPVGTATYASVDDLGSLTATLSWFGAITFGGGGIGGMVVPSGQLSCTGCVFQGSNYAIKAITLPSASSAPTVTLSTSQGQSPGKVGGRGTGILTDGTANINASGQVFQSQTEAYNDSLPTPSPVASSGAYGVSGQVDFGHGGLGSTGSNIFLGARNTAIHVTKPFAGGGTSSSGGGFSVVALGDTWNPGVQGANASGQYVRNKVFAPGAGTGTAKKPLNVIVDTNATGASVFVGPVPPPSPSPSPTPTGYPSASPSPSPTPTP